LQSPPQPRAPECLLSAIPEVKAVKSLALQRRYGSVLHELTGTSATLMRRLPI
jgi:hypothetical protein